jgi:hypothetical protein
VEGKGLDRADIERRVKRLEEQEMVDLDAPLRDAIPELARNMVRYREASAWWILASGEDPHAVCECEL